MIVLIALSIAALLQRDKEMRLFAFLIVLVSVFCYYALPFLVKDLGDTGGVYFVVCACLDYLLIKFANRLDPSVKRLLLQIILLCSIFVNGYGFVLWFDHQEPLLYNNLTMLIYSCLIISLSTDKRIYDRVLDSFSSNTAHCKNILMGLRPSGKSIL